MLTIFVGGGLSKRSSINARFVDSEAPEKVNFSPSFEFFTVDCVTLSCNIVGQVFDDIEFVVNIEEKICHLKVPFLTLDHYWGWIFAKSFNERIL